MCVLTSIYIYYQLLIFWYYPF